MRAPLPLILAMALAGCGEDGVDGFDLGLDATVRDVGVRDAQTGLDAGDERDAGAAADAALSPAEVACRELGSAAMMGCADGVQACQLGLARERCGSDRTEVLTYAFRCLNLFGQGSCPSFAVPMGALDCLQLSSDQFDIDAALDLNVAISGICGDRDHPARTALYRGLVPLIALSPERMARAASCVNGASDCVSAEACLRAEWPDASGC